MEGTMAGIHVVNKWNGLYNLALLVLYVPVSMWRVSLNDGHDGFVVIVLIG
jgi:hypothetical protein